MQILKTKSQRRTAKNQIVRSVPNTFNVLMRRENHNALLVNSWGKSKSIYRVLNAHRRRPRFFIRYFLFIYLFIFFSNNWSRV
jgi:hypothetical protein